jgi:hypothetical protein
MQSIEDDFRAGLIERPNLGTKIAKTPVIRKRSCVAEPVLAE